VELAMQVADGAVMRVVAQRRRQPFIEQLAQRAAVVAPRGLDRHLAAAALDRAAEPHLPDAMGADRLLQGLADLGVVHPLSSFSHATRMGTGAE